MISATKKVPSLHIIQIYCLTLQVLAVDHVYLHRSEELLLGTHLVNADVAPTFHRFSHSVHRTPLQKNTYKQTPQLAHRKVLARVPCCFLKPFALQGQLFIVCLLVFCPSPLAEEHETYNNILPNMISHEGSGGTPEENGEKLHEVQNLYPKGAEGP